MPQRFDTVRGKMGGRHAIWVAYDMIRPPKRVSRLTVERYRLAFGVNHSSESSS
jgi:hypothetical protein